MDNSENNTDEPNDELSMENEILKMKMKLQFGDQMMMGFGGDLPPEIENMFLKNVMAFEEMHSKPIEQITVFEKIGKPVFKNINDLKPNEAKQALDDIVEIMAEHDVILDICDGPYDDAFIYKFITEELFEQETDKESVAGIGQHFIYEEFHPNNKADIEKNTHDFLKHWFSQDFDEYCAEMGHEFVLAERRVLTQQEVYQKLKLFFDAYSHFQNDGYNIHEIDFTEFENGQAMGHVEGALKYEAVLENGEIVHFEGGYKLYMTREHNYWSIIYFVMPGFSW